MTEFFRTQLANTYGNAALKGEYRGLAKITADLKGAASKTLHPLDHFKRISAAAGVVSRPPFPERPAVVTCGA
ncbi:hypothetical protein [Rhodovulum sulfidophilum]|uniref:hypothetical protein n=1 Tax=Rhodovulum sulfidophilum TaxID=35806 RepID=UPI001389A3A6|nr:hypothetical protein [Rhodovulum sulfidophilum]